LSKIAAIPFRRIEASLSRRCDEIIVIAPAFIEALIGMNVPRTKITLVENWASLDEIFPLSQQNPWHQSMRLGERPVFLYSGTLGLKHRPDLLYKLAQALGERGQVVVISEGVGRNHLERLPKLDNLTMLDFQPYERLPEVLASADVLLATLETDAGSFAVPSKVLAYLCAGRPVLLAAPPNNLSSDIIRRSGGGIVVDPAAEQTLIQAALQLAQDAILRAELGANARSYAEKNFDIQRIAATFERILAKTIPELDTAPTGPRILTPR
jgi:glycosyltransferase involved in cell wall biosynthesis